MDRWDISGSWIGEYGYTLFESTVPMPGPTSFALNTERGWFGRFRGVALDSPKSTDPEMSAVRGRVRGHSVRFKKRYELNWVHSLNGRISLRQESEENWKLPMDKEPAPVPILYEGTYDPVEETVRGTWLIHAVNVRFQSQGINHAYAISKTTGTWWMRRQ